ncbi:hypothetical protein DVA67_012085 [Solirubrobacter sp. CPCC 204708]|uniref:DUF6351 family protein n=1 Tax=Solirubrobacter deserti TaxID=2282478 RepID=A0ABT4RLT8_9ACTN|nr:DUF6351 family protein [Solirubrobacter deserti]MBE2316716.1 hypothetical protein [Solirubrobacter deserti]MDA0139472.1 DUF6351 family protein [Solirubrobacter deserti]
MVGRASAVAVLLVAGLGAGSAHASGVQSLEVLSNRADLVSGGDALVAAKVSGPVTVDLNGTDVTSAFVAGDGEVRGLVSGLRVGENVLTVRDAGGAGKRLTITNHPIGGPIFSGPQVTPYACNPNASNPPLGAATDAQCNAPTKVELLYRNAANQFAPYDVGNPPADVQTTTTDRGLTVPFIVQRVTGTVNRGIYQLAVLVDPSKPIEPFAAAQPWSGKLLYTFGGACGTEHRQLGPENVLRQVQALGTGFAVATSSLNIYAQNCNDVVSAEAAMMTKEIAIERFGPVKYTLGTGGSAATMQQHLLAENYPGLLNGLMTSQAFEDHWTQVQGSLDCRVLMHYFWPTSPLSQPGHATAPPNALFPTAASRQPVWGSNPTNPDNLCGQKVLAFGADRTELVPGANVACGLQPAQVWHPVNNPTGERCGIADYMRAVFGVTVTPDAPNGKGKLAIDNVGVQYGLVALQRGQITPEQFVDLNAKVGGIDIDGNFVAARSVADPDALRIAYETGRVNSATGAANLPEIDNRTGGQMDDTGFHPAFHSFTYRARLDRSNGHHANQVIWLSRTGGAVPNQFDAMRRWLDTGEKPTEGCFMPGGVRGDLSCNGTWTPYGNPRLAAGVPYTLDIVKCQLKPLARGDYAVPFTDEQWATLQATFPGGVCDYSQPGVRQGPPKARWLTFADGPGGRALGHAPSAVEFVPATVGGTVPATLALSIAPAAFPPFAPGVDRDYEVTTTATVTSTAQNATLSHSEPGHMTNGAFTLAEPLRIELGRTTWSGPTSSEAVPVTFKQLIKSTDPLRTGSYSRTVTFTLSTTSP